jgi:predicted ArsR family transcriptional regulator
MTDETDQVAAVAALNLPLRRRIYDHVAAHREGVSRDGTAAALRVTRWVGAFNLEMLAEAGLVDVDFRRPEGRRGPGAGRPAKWYRRSNRDVQVTLPPRHYGLAAAILAEAVQRSGATAATAEVVREVALEKGRRIGAEDGSLIEVLQDHGYEPADVDGVMVMTNCPFHALIDDHRDLVCTMNQALLEGVAEQAGLPAGSAKLDPAPGRCCVTLRLGPPRRSRPSADQRSTRSR